MQRPSSYLAQNIPAGGTATAAGAAMMPCENGKTRAKHGVACGYWITS